MVTKNIAIYLLAKFIFWVIKMFESKINTYATNEITSRGGI